MELFGKKNKKRSQSKRAPGEKSGSRKLWEPIVLSPHGRRLATQVFLINLCRLRRGNSLERRIKKEPEQRSTWGESKVREAEENENHRSSCCFASSELWEPLLHLRMGDASQLKFLINLCRLRRWNSLEKKNKKKEARANEHLGESRAREAEENENHRSSCCFAPELTRII
ncbi:hypothetical protein CEXT_772161 [Caerostris extrusa]|uniref:Uncharacterized protein n=1 Tax=Caerostris extrusa TaxID=172846 RepID=A0AAV4XH65_CAEEX|nr:hypothetical protein CEXT_772161 [Caerostris extrusa]